MRIPKVSPLNKIAYGVGSVAFGIKGNGFDYFMLLFYSQVMGVDAYLVGLALLIALLVDAFSDPLIGYFSDNTPSMGASAPIYVCRRDTRRSVLLLHVESPSELKRE